MVQKFSRAAVRLDGSPLEPRGHDLAGQAPVVVVMVGAGALEALERFFAGVPRTPDCAFVLLRDFAGELDLFVQRLLARSTGLPTRPAAAGEPLHPGSIHLPASGGGSFRPVLAELTACRGKGVAAVVLSGDRPVCGGGLRRLHEAGGTVIVQEPASARFDAMPCAAIAAVPEAVVLPPEAMLPALFRRFGMEAAASGSGAVLEEVREMLRRRFSVDFAAYREEPLLRRLQRRAALRRSPDLAAFVALLRRDPAELERLHDDFLIGVTAFMRDTEAFEALGRLVLPALAARRRPVRVWVPACATGEEAFSIAMLLREHGRLRQRPLEFTILATDVHRRSLDLAIQAFYPEDRLTGVNPVLLERHFVRAGRGWRPHPELRRSVVFAPHDLLAEPPPGRMDLVSCRNLLIYLAPAAQGRVLEHLHDALLPGGFLFLGSSEGAGGDGAGFEPVEPHWRIYRRREGEGAAGRMAPPLGQLRSRLREAPAAQPLPPAVEALLAHLAPPGLLVDAGGAVLRVLHGEAVLAALAIEELPQRLSMLGNSVLRHALAAGLGAARLARRTRVEAGEAGSLAVTCLPVGEERYFLVCPEPASRREGEAGGGHQVARLEQELAGLAATLQASLADLQAANEELRAANDELQAANDELLSVNEELHLVSAEHEARLAELAQLEGDLQNLLRGSALAVVFLDEELALRRLTPRAAEVFAVGPGDLGRPFGTVRPRFEWPDMEEELRHCLDHEVALGRDVRAPGGSILRLELLPYRLASGEVAGVVLTVADVAALHRAESRTRCEAHLAAELAEGAGLAVCRLDPGLRVTAASSAFAALLEVDPAALAGRSLEGLLPPRAFRRLADAVQRLAPGAERCRVTLGTGPQRAVWSLSGYFAEGGRIMELQAVVRRPADG